MNSSQADLGQLVLQARDGNSDALGELLERHRGFLKVLAERILNGKLKARLDASDVVQRTCLSVHKAIGKFRGSTPAEFLAWVRQVHERNVQNLLREHLAQKRGIDLEAEQQQDLDGFIADVMQSSPSQRVLRNEDALRLTTALEHLSDDQREAVRLRYIEGLPVKEIGVLMGRSEKAAGALILRGLGALRKVLGDSDQIV